MKKNIENINIEQKRKGFTTKESRNKAQQKYAAKNREKLKYTNLKSSSKRFVLDYATDEDLEFLKNLIEERQKQ